VVEPSTRVLLLQSSVRRSSGGRFARSLAAAQFHGTDDYWRTMNIHQLDGTLWIFDYGSLTPRTWLHTQSWTATDDIVGRLKMQEWNYQACLRL